MIEENVLDVLTPPEEKIKKETVDRSILEAIEDRKISYPAELVGDTGINRQTVFDHLRSLKKQGKIERVVMHRAVPDILKGRLQELWDLGLKGAMIRRMSWYRIAEVKDEKKR